MKITITKRQNDIVRLIRLGHTNREIAEILKVSEQYIKNTVTYIYKRFEVKTRSEFLVKVYKADYEVRNVS